MLDAIRGGCRVNLPPRVVMGSGAPVEPLVAVDLLERPLEEPGATFDAGSVGVSLRPFQVLTLRFPRRRLTD